MHSINERLEQILNYNKQQELPAEKSRSKKWWEFWR